ncbi:type III secretion system outer membrane ring subunit SctC [Pseudomonas sp. Bout1]|uniref:type III secretion system outer membrane ring subunit SctC n=1 Tax=Pseudomonas sp. Bout1 TaxID=3048600 RepID=UPI002AB4B6E1|nr:type III secretion system outer membrane ring subunit SctC [Pseudomonas sp. Bout1]MDY7531753.1 type III secretion system outer membrane ring subunit SctC [Pseudomonas sp. Bout1]MEB0188062.1 type III secretion system outer membrane ring subunit SctC [Pseudomonas sp. Bout1]
MLVNRRRFATVFFWLLMLGSSCVLAQPYQAHDESLHTFFTALSLPLGQPIVVSQAAARKRISGAFDFDSAQPLLESVAGQHGLIWYSDGQVLYLYDADEAKSSVVTLRHISVDTLRGFMRRSGLDEARYPLRASGARVFYVSGPPNYVDHVLRLAQLMDRQRAELRMGSQRIGVVQVLNTHVADREYYMGDRTVTVPGMASMIEKLLAVEQQGASARPPGLLADKTLSVLAYPDTNSLLIKGKPAQVSFIQQLVAELDVPKRAVEVSLWLVDVDRDELKKLGAALHKGVGQPTATRVMAPFEDDVFMKRITALEQRRRAKVTVLPVILAQENVPAVFNDNQTLYLPRPGEDGDEWQPVVYGTQVSVLARFAEANDIEMQLTVEDGRQVGKAGSRDKRLAAIEHMGINTVVRVAPGRRLLVGDFQRDSVAALSGRYHGPMANSVRLFVIQATAVGYALHTGAGPGQAPPLTPSQHERVKRAFSRVPEG